MKFLCFLFLAGCGPAGPVCEETTRYFMPDGIRCHTFEQRTGIYVFEDCENKATYINPSRYYSSQVQECK